MVEQWSSKPYAWVRFLLSLFIISISPINKLNNYEKTLTKINKTKLSANLNKISYLKLYKKFNFSLYKLPIKLRKIIMHPKTINISSNLIYQSKIKKHNRLFPSKSKWNIFWSNRQNNILQNNTLFSKKKLFYKVTNSVIFSKNYLFLKKSKVFHIPFLNNLLSNNHHTPLLCRTNFINLVNYSTSLNLSTPIIQKTIQKSLKSNLIFKLDPICTNSTNKILNNTINLNWTSKTPPKFWLFFLYFIYEQKFIYNNRQKSSFVLSKVPFYKMDPTSPVTADKNRGNIYKKLALINLNRINKSVIKGNLNVLNHNVRFLTQALFAQSQTLTSTKLSWLDKINHLKLNQKHYKIITKDGSSLNYKLSQNFTFLKALITINRKNKLSSLFFNMKPKLKLRKKYKKFKPFDNKRLIRKQNFFKKKLKHISCKDYINKAKTFLLKKLHFKKNKSPFKAYKNHIIFVLGFLNWKINKRINGFNSFHRLAIKRKHYVTKLSRLNNDIYNSHNFHNLYTLDSRSKINRTWLFKQNNLITQNGLGLYKSNLGLHNFLCTNSNFLLQLLTNKLLYKINYLRGSKSKEIYFTSLVNLKFNQIKHINTNLIPNTVFKKHIKKKVLNSFSNKNFNENIVPWYFNTFVRFIEHCSGKKTLFQFYPFLAKSILTEDTIRYKRWLPRMVFYERKLGHRFFMEEALYLIHLSFTLKDPKIFSSWLKAIILRISFWKTRSIFRFIKYLFHNYFRYVFDELNVKGIKIKLKGKISAAGNSRKRTILYRVGKTSHSETNLRVLYEPTTVNTFTGVMGLGVWIFY